MKFTLNSMIPAAWRLQENGIPDYSMDEPAVRSVFVARLMSALGLRCGYPIKKTKWGTLCNIARGHSGDHGDISGNWRRRGGALLAVLIAVFMASAASAADYRLVDRAGNVVMAITHGTTIDLHDLADRNFLKIEAAFEDVDHASWVEFTLIHSARSFDYTRTAQSHENGWWSVCPSRCYALRRPGSVMLKSKVWFSDGQPSPAVGVIETDAITFRITDSKPTIRPPSPSQTRRPTCHGDPDVCSAIVGTPLWAALSRLCESRPGADIGLGNGATMRCP